MDLERGTERGTRPFFFFFGKSLLPTPCAENVSRCLLAFLAAFCYIPAIAHHHPQKAESQRSQRREGAMDDRNADSLPRIGVVYFEQLGRITEAWFKGQR